MTPSPSEQALKDRALALAEQITWSTKEKEKVIAVISYCDYESAIAIADRYIELHEIAEG